MEQIVIFDLATLRFRRSARGTSMSVVAASGEVLAVVDTLAIDRNEDAAYAACEHALAAGNVEREGTLHKIALYNPYSAEISYKAAPDSEIFGDGEAHPIAVDGSVANIEDEEGRTCIILAGKRIKQREITLAGATRAWSANEERRGR
jgi:hypothetical protein